MGYLVIDIGNTSIKTAIFNSLEDLCPAESVVVEPTTDPITVIGKGLDTWNPKKVMLSTVSKVDHELAQFITDHQILLLTPQINHGFKSLYQSPETLGMDRVAAVAGALALSKGLPAMVIDAGTCITYEYINHQQQYEGGAISPGLQMRLKAMNHYTAKLPLLVADDQLADVIGRDTISCMLAGAQRGFIAEIDVFIDVFKNKFPDSVILVCGGDAPFIEKNSKHRLHLEKHLVLLGLLKILKANA